MDGLRIPINTWQDQLVRFVWKCRVRRYTKYGVRRKRNPLNRTHPLGPSHIYYTPSLYWKNPRYGRINYFELPEDAWALRRCLISDHDILTVKRGVLQIGILQREKSRSITNLPELVTLLEKGIPDANITVLHIIPPSLQAQAVWFATKDIIIASHGAALMNCIFILPRTIVMQLYPPDYFFQSLESIIESVGGIALDWYEGTDPVYDWHQAVREGRNNVARDANITAPPHEIVDPILFTMGRKPTPLEWENVNNGSERTKNLLWMN
jgi:Glycosyltransferase 61